jgi:hypothetical protein
MTSSSARYIKERTEEMGIIQRAKLQDDVGVNAAAQRVFDDVLVTVVLLLRCSSEAKDHVEQLSREKVFCCVLLCWLPVVAMTLVATALVCLHDASLIRICCGKWSRSGARRD